MVKFTFIIPHYNLTPSLLQRCLDSIPHRDDIQIIVVDDHSPSLYDDKGRLIPTKKNSFAGSLDEYTDVIFLPKNVGPGIARNEALKQAKGEWIFFADADDYYEKEALSSLMCFCENTTCDAIWFGYGDNNIYGNIPDDIDNGIVLCSKTEKLKFLKVVAPWNKVVRKSLLYDNNIKFDEGFYCEDQFYSLRTVCECKSAGFYNRNVYIHLTNEGSLSKTEDLRKLSKGMEIELRYNAYLQAKGFLCLECRNFLIGGLLYRIYNQSRWLYRWYCIKEFFSFGREIAWADYKQSCIQRNIRPNFWYQLTDPIRVKLGSLFHK